MFFLQLVSELSVEDLGELVAWKLPGVAGNAWNGLIPAVALQLAAVAYGKFVFLATGRPGDCMEMLLECLRNPGHRVKNLLWIMVQCLQTCSYNEGFGQRCVCGCAVERKTTVGYGEETLACNNSVKAWRWMEIEEESEAFEANRSTDCKTRTVAPWAGGTVRCQSWSDGCNVFKGNKVNGNSAWPLAPVWPGVRNSTVEF
eukprot:Gb_35451 [translate_table: standard]